MPVSIVKVKGKALLKEFIVFPERLYKDCENWVPALRGDEYDAFNPKTNAAFEYCEAQCFLAVRDGKTVGRVAAIINHNANATWKEEAVRFGWLDFIEDMEVLRALVDAVAAWGKQRGCVAIKGPWGFTDMDKEGCLVEGFENLCPFTCLYNFPYYDAMLSQLGFVKDCDWLQRICYLDSEMPPMYQYAETIEKRFGLSIAREKNINALARKYGMDIFHMYNEAFAPLFEFAPLSDAQIKRYLKTYIPILDPRFVAICLNSEGKPIGFCFNVPSLSKAVKKSGGKLFPLGLFRILRALKKNDTLESLMVGIPPEYQGKGASVLMFKYLHENCLEAGIKRMLLNPQLEENFKVQSMFDQFRTEPYMRRRAYRKEI